ncbi:hypothetical protein SAMD00023353_2600990 [Rosellinia necatrix]|uniref:Uncharacterized protein n=1 Tax=Rosellinia necatrix TaxID=77044 RepID=A0A1W2TH61_ROSNE|nr:hypothetical protein SAMD00023353_2600990 [Rosellinia necatrix]
MLRVATTHPAELDAPIETHHPRPPGPTHSKDQEPRTLFEPGQEPPSKPIARPPVHSIERNTSSGPRQHQRQQSAPSVAARHPNAPSPPPSIGHNRTLSQGMALTGDRRGGNSPARRGGRSSGTSTPPTEYDITPLSHRPRTPVDTTPRSAAPSRFGFLASAFSSRVASPIQTPARTDDELCDLDIGAVLYPALSPLDGDTFSPAAYKNLQANATGLLHRMQDAYRQRTVALREMQAEREAQKEEMEEMELRTRHFKSQLEKMAAKAAEQEEAMQQLVAELQAEKRARLEERANREKMFRVVEDGASVVDNEDLCVDEEERKRWRASNSTVKSELSIDTDGDSAESESIFSRSRSPTAMTCVTETETLDVPPTLHPRAAAAMPPKPKSAQPQQPQQLTAFQRLVKGVKGENAAAAAAAAGPDACRNCKGKDASVAWDTVSLLRDENLALKQRVAHLDVVIEGALDIVNGFKT